MEEFKVGDVVYLNSGGPDMTIYQIDSQYYYTIWFHDNEIRKDGFLKAIVKEKTYEV